MSLDEIMERRTRIKDGEREESILTISTHAARQLQWIAGCSNPCKFCLSSYCAALGCVTDSCFHSQPYSLLSSYPYSYSCTLTILNLLYLSLLLLLHTQPYSLLSSYPYSYSCTLEILNQLYLSLLLLLHSQPYFLLSSYPYSYCCTFIPLNLLFISLLLILLFNPT